MRRLAALVLSMALAAGACSQVPPIGQQPAGQGGGQQAGGQGAGAPTTQPAAGDLRFTITYTFNTQADQPEYWNAGTFTTTGSLTRALIDGMTSTRGYIGFTWPSSGTQQFGDYFCHTPDECLEPCVGAYDGSWQDEPYIGRISGSGSDVVLDAQLSPKPKPIDDSFLQSATSCPPAVNNGFDAFPPMRITINGLGGASPTYSIAWYQFDDPEGTLSSDGITIAPRP